MYLLHLSLLPPIIHVMCHFTIMANPVIYEQVLVCDRTAIQLFILLQQVCRQFTLWNTKNSWGSCNYLSHCTSYCS